MSRDRPDTREEDNDVPMLTMINATCTWAAGPVSRPRSTMPWRGTTTIPAVVSNALPAFAGTAYVVKHLAHQRPSEAST